MRRLLAQHQGGHTQREVGAGETSGPGHDDDDGDDVDDHGDDHGDDYGDDYGDDHGDGHGDDHGDGAELCVGINEQTSAGLGQEESMGAKHAGAGSKVVFKSFRSCKETQKDCFRSHLM